MNAALLTRARSLLAGRLNQAANILVELLTPKLAPRQSQFGS